MDMDHHVLLVVCLHACAMDCNPRVQLIHFCVPVSVWTTIPESKLPKVLFTGTRMNETKPTTKESKHKNMQNKKGASANEGTLYLSPVYNSMQRGVNSQMPRNSELVEAMIPALRGCGESWKTSRYGQRRNNCETMNFMDKKWQK